MNEIRIINPRDPEPHVWSPLPALDLEAANTKLRKGAHTFTFDTDSGGFAGRVDVAVLETIDPCWDQWDLARGEGVGRNDTIFAGIYEGHLGWVTSRLLVKTLIPKISKALARMPDDVTEENLASDIQKVLERLDEDMKLAAIDSVPPGIAPFTAETVSAHAPMISGSSALICIYDLRRRSLRTVQVGTSRAIRGDWDRLRRDFHVDVLVVEHNGLNDTEVEDMDMRHPGENLFRGSSLITRAFGYLQWKWDLDETNWLAEQGLCPPAPEGNISPPYMRATPDVGIHWPKLNDFVILASSGFWELMSNEDALHCVSTWLAWKRSGLPPPDLPEEPLESHEPKYRRVPPSLFVYEDLDNVSVCLIKNALGGRRRKQFLGNMSTCYPDCTLLRRDITVQVIFCRDPYITCGLFKDKF